MKTIDKLISHLQKLRAEALVMASNAPVVARIAEGDRTSNQVLDHPSVAAMIQEVAPPMALADLRASRPTKFSYDGGEVPALVEVQPAPGAWRVVIHRVGSPPLYRRLSSGNLPRVEDSPTPASGLGALSNLVERRSIPAPESQASASASVPMASPSLPRELGARAAEAAQRLNAESGRIDRLLRLMTQKGASDMHLSTGCPPLVRLHGEVLKLEESAALTDDALRVLLAPTIPARNREEFDRRKDTDYAYEVPNLARFRVNLFVDRNGTGAVFRRIPFEIVPPEKLGLSAEVLELCNLSKGLVLVTGPTGSGKSTTLASMVDRINNTRDDHIITIEDPIEFVHQDKRCLVNQREVRVHTEGFRQALRAALRQDPDIVLVGEMRDLETVEIAIETAETGHLVFGTLHTSTAPSTVDRIIDQFPADRQAQIRTMLSESLKGVIAQTLCKRIGGGRVGVFEVLLGTTAVANMIREAKTFQLYGLMQSNRGIGMMTLNDALLEHVLGGRIDVKDAYVKAVNKSELRSMLGNHGLLVPE